MLLQLLLLITLVNAAIFVFLVGNLRFDNKSMDDKKNSFFQIIPVYFSRPQNITNNCNLSSSKTYEGHHEHDKRIETIDYTSYNIIQFVTHFNGKKKIALSPRLSIRSEVISNDCTYPDFSFAILLQPSPVQSQNQVIRLKAIDNGWSSWVSDSTSSLFNKVHVIAAISRIFNNLKNISKFKNIKTILINPNQSSMSPYINMIEVFTILSTSKYNYKWLVFGNDHTFMIPQNLACHLSLSSLDHDLPVYSGNKLQRGEYKNSFLYFASGGAGGVISFVGLKLVVISWILTGNPIATNSLLKIKEFMNEHMINSHYKTKLVDSMNYETEYVNVLIGMNISYSNKRIICGYNCHVNVNKIKGFERRNDGRDFSFFPVLFEIQSFIQNSTFSKSKKLIILRHRNNEERIGDILVILLSPKQVLLMRWLEYPKTASKSRPKPMKDVFTKEYFLSLNLINSITNESLSIDPSKLKNCNPDSDWARMNPGLVIAYCLQIVFGANFKDSRSSDGTEKFNVYGLLRTIVGDYDSWYIDAKEKMNYSAAENTKIENKFQLVSNKMSVNNVAEDAISFHYVSEQESLLLFELLSRVSLNASSFDIDELRNRWPSSHAAIGHYSRKVRTKEEFDLLFETLTRRLKILPQKDCGMKNSSPLI